MAGELPYGFPGFDRVVLQRVQGYNINYPPLVIGKMARIYQLSPITEAVCEFRFEPSQPWDSTILGLVYDRLKSEFPKKKQQLGFQVELRASSDPIQQMATPSPRMQFLSEDERSLVQLATDLISVNKLKPYQNWESFKETIVKSLKAYTAISQPKGIRRIGLRYINRIDIPEDQVKIEDYISAVPSLPEPIPQVYETWVLRVEIPFREHGGILVVQSGSVREAGKDGITFLLDLDFIVQRAETIALNSAGEMIEIAHNEVEKAFEACITDKTRALFKEIKPNG